MKLFTQKRVFLFLLALLVLFAASAAWIVMNLGKVIDSNKDYILAQVKQAVGRDVTLEKIDVTLWPGAGVRLSKFIVSDDPQFSAEKFISAEDLQYLGGSLQLDADGHLTLQGDPGISAGIKDELASIKGQPRIIPVFDQVTGPGNNARYRIVQFAGVRIMDVKLTGSMSSKRVTIQPANVLAVGGIPSPGSNRTSRFVYSPVWLVR